MKRPGNVAYKNAPLPFQGQKRFFIREFEAALRAFVSRGKVHTIVDLFGGSGLLSHTAKRLFPECAVVYNDYDGFSERLTNAPRTNTLLRQIREIIGDLQKGCRIGEPVRGRILDRIAATQSEGYVDYITLSGSLLFSGKRANNYAELVKETFYNTVAQKEYDASGYLDGLIVEHRDYREVFDRYKNSDGVLFIVDPPYLSTDTASYRSDKYWKLKDYLDVLKVIKNRNYIFFTSEKSSLVELCEWLAENNELGNPFHGAIVNQRRNSINYNSSYADIMLFRGVSSL